MATGKLYLIPTPLGETGFDSGLPATNHHILDSIDIYIVEELRTARRFLKRAGISKSIDSLVFHELNEHTAIEDASGYLDEAYKGANIGLLSDAGLPCIADPGNIVVKQAHTKGIEVIPLVGPSSLMLALMASGMNGQNFIFHGYLPVNSTERTTALKALERDISQNRRTQIFIETPYRNMAMLESIIKSCHPETVLCIATDLTLDTQYISTRLVRQWKNNPPGLHKRPAVFLLGA